MIIINHPWELNKEIKQPFLLVLSYNFLTVYGLPYCLLYSKKLKKLNTPFKIVLDLYNEQATATLAILENFPYIIVNKKLHKELNIIKSNSKSNTIILDNLKEASLISNK